MEDNRKTEVKETREMLIERRGYLKIPDEFRMQFGTPKKYPNPKSIVEKRDGIIRLIYEWEVEKGTLKEGTR